jgi:predicted ATP-dependent Lon-type protease
VRKDLVRKYSRQYPVPTYVVEFLLGRYCASRESGSWQRRTDAEAKAGQLH